MEVVVEVGEVDERQCRRVLLDRLDRCVRDPATRRQAGFRSPEVEERKRAEIALELLAVTRRPRVHRGDLASVRGIEVIKKVINLIRHYYFN